MPKTHTKELVAEVFVHPDTGASVTTMVRKRTEKETRRLKRLANTLGSDRTFLYKAGEQDVMIVAPSQVEACSIGSRVVVRRKAGW